MGFYNQLFLGFYCLTKKLLSKEANPEAYATAFMAGALSFVYFAATLFFFGAAANTLETVGVFLVAYALHHFLFVSGEKYRQIEQEKECSNQLIFRSLLYFFVCLSLLMYASTVTVEVE